MVTRYIIHDAVAQEVDSETFFHTRESGGTVISSAYELCNKIIEEEYPQELWNVYVFHFSDGDNWSGGDTDRCINMLKSDLLPALIAARDGLLKSFDLRWHDEHALTVVMAAEGYPGEPRTGTVIEGLDAAAKVEGVTIFHAGTRRDPQGRLVAAGGRVLNVTATGPTLAEARERAYRAVDLIRWPEGFCRRDIGWRALRARS